MKLNENSEIRLDTEFERNFKEIEDKIKNLPSATP